MLDPAKLLETMQASLNMGQSSQASLSKTFLQGVNDIKMSGPDTASSVLKSVTQSGDSMLNNMKGIFDGLQANVSDHQAMQAKEIPKDFNSAMNDLRETIAKGFPGEMAEFFSKLPKM
ncbi:DUF6277 family protein [Pseudomonas sp. TTU2014-080ASC]|uniref:DUF6277 family protein n=1 Tax=Pseudomonas sp. TTU2014-080ASC TaxID=1729724 RepID=UPI0007185E85|nr:DUF6277 family protein [Pseudomonas sp. TTU2014-080ASC]KRW62589.1 hypothetical protein AO726_04005 [Pseudomonas sp. TTU2014-080ASC]